MPADGDRRTAERTVDVDAVGLLAGGVAHDFNNILLAIQLYTDILAQQTERPDESPVAEIRAVVARGRELAADLLTLSRDDLGAGSDDLPQIDLLSFVTDCRSALRQSLPAEVRIDIRGGDQTPQVAVAADQLRHLLLALARYAGDGMTSGGRFTIEIGNADRDTLPGSHVVMRVTDSAGEPDAGDLDRLFEPYYALRRLRRGSGLGLAICQAMVTRWGGTLVAERWQGGTRFEFCLPNVAAGSGRPRSER